MVSLQRGAASATFEIAPDGIVRGEFRGLLVPANAGAISALLLQAAVEQGGRGLICSVERSLVALPPIDPDHYRYVPEGMLAVPVAIVLSHEQMRVYERVTGAAALSGVTRRGFLWREEAEAWMQQQARALSANRVWWSERRSRP